MTGFHPITELRCTRCGHDGYAHGLPAGLVLGNTSCDSCDCPRWTEERE